MKKELINIHKQIFNSHQKKKYNNRIVELDFFSKIQGGLLSSKEIYKMILDYFNVKFYFSKVWFEKKNVM